MLIIAQTPEAFESISRAFTEGQDMFDLRPLYLGGVALLLLLVAVWGYKSQRQRIHKWQTPIALFHELADRVELKPRDRSLLMRIAEHAALPSPITLLLSGETFVHHAERYTRSLTKPRRRWITGKIQALHTYLFAEPG